MDIQAWHFVGSTLRNGQPIPQDGVTLRYDGPLPVILCKRGLHASSHPFDALQYAPGDTLCRVRLGGAILSGTDKHVATERTILARIDAEPLLRQFARRCAMNIIGAWDAPAIVREYLETGDESKRAAARDAASACSWPAPWTAAWNAARDVARDAAWNTASWNTHRAWFAEMVDEAFSPSGD